MVHVLPRIMSYIARSMMARHCTRVAVKLKYRPQRLEWIIKSSFFLNLPNKIIFQVNFVTN